MLWLWDCYANPRPWSNPRRGIAAPTRDQVKAIYWRDIKALTPKAWIQDISETELAIFTRWGAELRLVGLDKPERVEGQPWDELTIDEYASTKAGIFDANIRPAIADRQGRVDFLGVPDFSGPAQAEYENFCELGQGGAPEWADFSWGSEGILPASEIDSMRRSMDPRLFEQETTGRFILAGGRAFPDFSVASHVRSVEYDPSLPLCWSLDFNINPMCSGVIQYHLGEVRVIDEFNLPDTSTEAACREFKARAELRGWNISNLRVYGDPSGNARDSTSGISDWFIVQNQLKQTGYKLRVPRSHAPIKDTINAVNAKLKSADGKIALAISPRCDRLVEDLKAALAGTDMEDQHAVAWLRYFCEQEFPVQPAKKESGPMGHTG